MPENNLKMTPKAKKILFIALFAVDVALTVFLFVVSIIMLATLPEYKDDIDPSTFIGYLQANPTVFLLAFVIPLFVLLVANIVALVFYFKRNNEKKKVGLNELSDEEKEALRRELMKDLAGGGEEKEEKKEDIE